MRTTCSILYLSILTEISRVSYEVAVSASRSITAGPADSPIRLQLIAMSEELACRLNGDTQFLTNSHASQSTVVSSSMPVSILSNISRSFMVFAASSQVTLVCFKTSRI